MKEQLKILCITCPKGCSLEVTRDGETIVRDQIWLQARP